MARSKAGPNKTTAGPTPVHSIRHKDKRANIPTEELRDFVADDEAAPKAMLYPRDPSLDPQLVWQGKDEQDAEDLAVPVVPVYIQEKIHPQAIIEDIRDCVEKARETGAAALGERPRDTIKTMENGVITGTIDRSRLINVQTPQVFSVSLFKRAHEQAHADGFVGTDDCMLVERLGHPISYIEATRPNIKLTTQEDIALAQYLAGASVRTGIGYDAHRLVTTRPLILGGVEIPHTHGLLGHSDADVLTHAIMDALLGAAALGDIGRHFPGTDEFKDISSLVLLARVRNLIEEAGYAIVNVGPAGQAVQEDAAAETTTTRRRRR